VVLVEKDTKARTYYECNRAKCFLLNFNYSPLSRLDSIRSMFSVNSEAVLVYPVFPCATMLYSLFFDSLDKSNSQTVGYPLTLNACCKFLFCCLNLAGSCFLLGKSNSRRTTFLSAQSLNSL